MTDKLRQEASGIKRYAMTYEYDSGIEPVLSERGDWVDIDDHLAAATAREKEIEELRAKLEAVPVEEIRRAIEYARNLPEGYEERNAAESVEYWLLRLAK